MKKGKREEKKKQFNGMEKQTSSAEGDERSSWWSCRFVVRVTRSTIAWDGDGNYTEFALFYTLSTVLSAWKRGVTSV